MKVHCERISRSVLRGKRAKWKPCFFTSLHFEDSLQLTAGSFNLSSPAQDEIPPHPPLTKGGWGDFRAAAHEPVCVGVR